MRRANLLLRIWVIVGAVLLLLQTPQGQRVYAEYSPGSCINVQSSQPSCPSGCTGSTFQQNSQAAGNGIFYLTIHSTTPCGSAKQGQQCNNPTQYYFIEDFQDCCAALGDGCTGRGQNYMNCCAENAYCIADKCCIPDTYSGCGTASDCCSGGPCVNGTCQGSDCGQPGDYCSNVYPCCSGYNCADPNGGTCCPNTCPFPACSDPGAYCWVQCGCPGNEACSECYTACYDEMSQGCEATCEECDVCC